MKKLTIILAAIVTFIATITLTQTLQSCSAQKPDPTTYRYFEAQYIGTDQDGKLQYGTYFFISTNDYPTVEYVNRLIVESYNLKFDYNNTNKLATIMAEFKTQAEWLKFKRR